MIKLIACMAIVAGLTVACVETMDHEWLADYQKTTGQSARFVNSDDECLSNEHFDPRYGLCVKMHEFTVEDKL